MKGTQGRESAAPYPFSCRTAKTAPYSSWPGFLSPDQGDDMCDPHCDLSEIQSPVKPTLFTTDRRARRRSRFWLGSRSRLGQCMSRWAIVMFAGGRQITARIVDATATHGLTLRAATDFFRFHRKISHSKKGSVEQAFFPKGLTTAVTIITELWAGQAQRNGEGCSKRSGKEGFELRKQGTIERQHLAPVLLTEFVLCRQPRQNA